MKIPIVDDNDEIMGYKERSELRSEDIYRVAALWIINSKGDVLLAQRVWTKKNGPGRWGPAVAGTVDRGESYEENVIKEAEEELAIVDEPLREGPKKRVFGNHNYFCQWYTLTTEKKEKDFKVQEDEVAKVKWWRKSELAKQMKEHPERFIPSVVHWAGWFCTEQKNLYKRLFLRSLEGDYMQKDVL